MDQPEDKGPNKEIDLKKILLPNKEVHTADSAERVNAGVLLEQEQKAELPKPEAAPAPAPAAKTEPAKNPSEIRPLETYQGDIESLVEKKNVSVVSIAAAEADKKHESAPAKAPGGWLWPALYIGGGVLLVLVVAGVWVYIAARAAPVVATPIDTESPFITVDDSEAVPVNLATRASLMNALVSAKSGVNISLGLIERLDPVEQTLDAQGNATQTEVGIQDLLTTLAPEMPQELTRTLQPTYLLGVHSYDENEAFLIMQTDSYETAYAGMLAWETTMQSDLSPLFDRTPPVHPAQQTGGSSQATTTASTTPAQTNVLDTAFSDQVVDNRDARVVTDQYGDILLLWTFLDRNTIVIANNEETLREIITRVTAPATTGLGQ